MEALKSDLEQFRSKGFINLGSVVDESLCAELLAKILQSQPFSPDIFLDEKEFLKAPKYKDVNPKQGRNILENYENIVSDIEQTKHVDTTLSGLLGEDYFILGKKVICGVPEEWIPLWVKGRIKNNPVNNLGAYIKPEYRHITYFYGIDFHQDIIDWPDREPDFITLYVYLHEVPANAAPLNLLVSSHQLGVDKFPHDLQPENKEKQCWLYNNHVGGKTLSTKQLVVTGGAGNVALWHSYMIHGTKPNCSGAVRLSLRYLIAKSPDAKDAYLEEVNKGMSADRFTAEMREDLARDGDAMVKKNYLYSQYQDK